MPEDTTADLENVCELLDKLTVDTLTLMQREIQQKIDLEQLMVDGEGNLSKARYILGQNQVSQLQLPTEDSPEFEALAVIQHDAINNDDVPMKLLDLRKPEIKSDASDGKLQDPVKWFGILVPQCVHMAQMKYRQALVQMVGLANTNNALKYSCDATELLKGYKKSLLMRNE